MPVAKRNLQNLKILGSPLQYTGQIWDALELKAWKGDWDNPFKWVSMQASP